MHLTLLMMVMLIISFVSCGDDDDKKEDNPQNANLLVGNWYYLYEWDEDVKNEILLIYDSNGTFTWEEYNQDGDWTSHDNYKGNYVYDEDEERLIMTFTRTSDSNAYARGQVLEFNVISLNSKKLVIGEGEYDERWKWEDYAYTFSKTTKSSL